MALLGFTKVSVLSTYSFCFFRGEASCSCYKAWPQEGQLPLDIKSTFHSQRKERRLLLVWEKRNFTLMVLTLCQWSVPKDDGKSGCGLLPNPGEWREAKERDCDYILKNRTTVGVPGEWCSYFRRCCSFTES